MSKPDILVVRSTRPAVLAELEAHFTLLRMDQAEDKQAFLAAHGAHARGLVINGGFPLDSAFLAQVPQAEIAASFGVGYDAIDVAACSEHQVQLTNTPDVLTDDVADMALALLLAARRNMIGGHAHVASGAWGRDGPMPLTRALRGKRAGIVGLGRIGQAIAARCAAFGLEIGYTARSAKDVPYTRHDTPRDLAAWADILIVAVPGGASTEGMIDAEVLTALGAEGTLVNIARGSVIDEAALIAALTDGRLGSAALDVFVNEPTPDPALVAAPNVVLHPHHASGTVETRDAMARLVNENLISWFAGKGAVTPVNDPRPHSQA